MARAICELWDLLVRDEVYLEFDLIDAIDQLLIEYPNPHLERHTRDFEEYTLNMGFSYDLYDELLLATHNHMRDELKKTIMASRIKRHFKKAISDPSYKMCRDRLMREYVSDVRVSF